MGETDVSSYYQFYFRLMINLPLNLTVKTLGSNITSLNFRI